MELMSDMSRATESRVRLLNAISRDLVSQRSVTDLLTGVLRLTMDALNADTGSILLLNPNGTLHDFLLRMGAEFVANGERLLGGLLSDGLIAEVIATRAPQRVTNTVDDPRWCPDPPATTPRDALALPIIGETEELIGVLTIARDLPDRFGEDDQALLEAIAQMTAVAIANVRGYEESQRRSAAMARLVETSRMINATLDPREVIQLLLDRTLNVIGVNAASIALVDEGSDEIVFEAAAGESAKDVVGMRLALGTGIAGWVAATGKPVLSSDVSADVRFFAGVDTHTGFGTRAIIAAPIHAQGRILGVVEALNPARGFFDENDLQLLASIANMAGNALAHARAFAETEADRARYASLFEGSGDLSFVTDREGRILDINRKALSTLGYTWPELVNHNLHTLQAMPEAARSALQRGGEAAFETTIMGVDREPLPVHVVARVVTHADQALIQWIERDISEERRIEEIRDDLTAMLFHDLRSPVGNIRSGLSLLRQQITDELAITIMDVVERSAVRMTRLLDSLLDLNRLEAGRMVLDARPVAVGRLMAESIEQVEALATSKQIELIADQAETPLPDVVVDLDMMRRVVINLLENAIKYTPGTGEGRIVLHAGLDQAGTLTITVTDNGMGIPTEKLEAIFEKFNRVDPRSPVRGVGLGLTFSKLAVEAHGGRIWVESEPDCGSTFGVTLPLDFTQENRTA